MKIPRTTGTGKFVLSGDGTKLWQGCLGDSSESRLYSGAHAMRPYAPIHAYRVYGRFANRPYVLSVIPAEAGIHAGAQGMCPSNGMIPMEGPAPSGPVCWRDCKGCWDAICYAVSANGASPHRMRPSKSLFPKELARLLL
jgi:hypothetical protein